MKLRSVILALQREGYARKAKPPPDTLGTKQLSMPCLNPDCQVRATLNYGIDGEHRQGLYNCRSCGLRGDAVSLIINLAGHDLNPYDEMSDTEVVGMAHVWAETHAGAERATPAETRYDPYHDDD